MPAPRAASCAAPGAWVLHGPAALLASEQQPRRRCHAQHSNHHDSATHPPAMVDTKMDSRVQACTVMPTGMGTRKRSARPMPTAARKGTGLAPCTAAQGGGAGCGYSRAAAARGAHQALRPLGWQRLPRPSAAQAATHRPGGRGGRCGQRDGCARGRRHHRHCCRQGGAAPLPQAALLPQRRQRVPAALQRVEVEWVRLWGAGKQGEGQSPRPTPTCSAAACMAPLLLQPLAWAMRCE